MTGITHKDLLSFAEGLRRTQEITASHLSRSDPSPERDSAAAHELKACVQRQLLKTAYSQFDLLIQVAAEQLEALLRTCGSPMLTIAPWCCGRNLMVASALAAWLLEPTIDAHTRIKRSLSFRFEGLVQQQKFAGAARGRAATESIARQIEVVEQKALQSGFSKLVDKKGRRTGIGQQTPTITSLVRDVLKDEATYRLFSAMTHAHPWAFQQLSFQILEDQPPNHDKPAEQGGRELSLKKAIKPAVLAYLLTRSQRFFIEPIRRKSVLFGWNPADLEQQIAALKEDFFWLRNEVGQKSLLKT